MKSMLSRATAVAAVLQRVPLRGRGRLAHVLHRRFGARSNFVLDVTMRNGECLALPMNSSQAWRVALTGRYDDEVLELLCRHIEPGSLVVDVGASLGLYTVPLGVAARAVRSRVLAVEPLERNCTMIQANVERNGLSDVVRLVRCALGASDGVVLLHGEPGGVGNAVVVTGLEAGELARHDAAGGHPHEEEVQVMRLDDVIWPGDMRVSLIKIDVEGFEFDVLEGAERTLVAHRPIVFAELSVAWLDSRGVPAERLRKWLAKFEYRCFEVQPVHMYCWSDRRRIRLSEVSGAEERNGYDLLLVPEGQRAVILG